MPYRPKRFQLMPYKKVVRADHDSDVKDCSEAQVAVELIAEHIKGLHVDRIGIDGLPGCGKSTLARALAIRLQMKWVSVEYQIADIDLGQSPAIYEHHRLFRTQDLDKFDVLIYIDEPLLIVKRRIAQRGREHSSEMLERFDFIKMQDIGRRAFAMASGEPWCVPETNIRIKLRPEGGFEDMVHIKSKLKAMGIEYDRRSSKEALLEYTRYG